MTDSYREATKTPHDRQQFWLAEIQAAEKELKAFQRRGSSINERFLGSSGTLGPAANEYARKFNLFAANVHIMKAALYAKLPQCEVIRRFRDKDDAVARVASMILERNLDYELEDNHDYDEVFKTVIMDRLIPGMGVVWNRYEAEVDEIEGGQGEVLKTSNTPLDYVYWKDLLYSPARIWRQIWWVARKLHLSRDELVKHFGENGKKVALTKQPRSGTTVGSSIEAAQDPKPNLRKGCVYEIWNKRDKNVIWIAQGLDAPLKEKNDFLELPRFFPMAKPLVGGTTSTNFVPQSDYMLCQDQYEELNVINTRISYLVEACKVVGLYNKKSGELVRLLQQGVENQMIPVDQWAAFAERGGIKGQVDWLPIEVVAAVITQLNMARDVIKQQIYELTGLADVIRGASAASETAAAQKIKAQYASVRFTDAQEEVAKFFSEIFNIKAFLMAKYYSPEQLILQAGTLPVEDQQYVEAAVALLKNEYAARFRIRVTSDTFTDVDWQREKEERMEFLTAASQFIEKAAAAAEAAPETAPMMFGLLKFAVAGFKSGREAEGIIDSGMQAAMQAQAKREAQPPEPSPEEQQAQAEMQKIQAQMQALQEKTKAEIAKLQAQVQAEQNKGQMELMIEKTKAEIEVEAMRARIQLERENARMEAMLELQKARQEMFITEQKAAQDLIIAREKAELEHELAEEKEEEDEEKDEDD